jgi:hypothetical protein
VAASGSVLSEVELSAFYAEDDRVSIPRIVRRESAAGTVRDVAVNTNQTLGTSSPVRLILIDE